LEPTVEMVGTEVLATLLMAKVTSKPAVANKFAKTIVIVIK